METKGYIKLGRYCFTELLLWYELCDSLGIPRDSEFVVVYYNKVSYIGVDDL